MLYVCLPVSSRQSDGAKIQKENILEAYTLAAYGFWQVIIRVTKIQLTFVV